VLPENIRSTRCVYCASPNVVNRPSTDDRPEPTLVLPFVVGEDRARSFAREWLKTRGLFREPALKRASLDEIRSVYLPAYLVSGAAHTEYHAEIGEDYRETEHYTTTDDKGNEVTKTRTVTRTEWRPLSGTHASYLESLVSASRGLKNDELEAVEPFDFRRARRYGISMVSGWAVEEPSLTLEACVRTAHQEMLTVIGRRISKFMPGDSHRDLTHSTKIKNQSSSLVLVPIWVLAARFDAKSEPVRIVMNGQSGRIHGQAPYSIVRIALAVTLGVLLVVTTYFLLTRGGR